MWCVCGGGGSLPVHELGLGACVGVCVGGGDMPPQAEAERLLPLRGCGA
mgnify:CR=1 FL=1